MKKAYNVFKTYEKISVTASLRKFVLMIAFGACFFGFQSEAVSQSAFVAVPAQQTNEDAKFLFNSDFSASSEDAALILREQLQSILQMTDAEDGAEQNELLARYTVLKVSTESLARGVDVPSSLAQGYFEANRKAINFSTTVDVRSIVEEYARLLE